MSRHISIYFFFVVVLSIPFAVTGQAWEKYQWEYYNIEFELPETFTVTTNTEEALEANANGVQFALYPFLDSALDGLDIAGYVVKMAEYDLNLDQIDEMELMEFEGMKGGFVSGAKEDLQYLVLGLVDPDSKTNFSAFVAFEKEREAELTEDAMKLLLSINLLD